MIPAQKEKKRDLPGNDLPYVGALCVWPSWHPKMPGEACPSPEKTSAEDICANGAAPWRKQCGHRCRADLQSLRYPFHQHNCN